MRISVNKWPKVLGGIQSMEFSLPGVRVVFRNIQEALCRLKGNRVTLTRGVHATLSEFRWLTDDLDKCPTFLYELVPISPTMDVHHDASGTLCGGFLLPSPNDMPRELWA